MSDFPSLISQLVCGRRRWSNRWDGEGWREEVLQRRRWIWAPQWHTNYWCDLRWIRRELDDAGTRRSRWRKYCSVGDWWEMDEELLRWITVTRHSLLMMGCLWWIWMDKMDDLKQRLENDYSRERCLRGQDQRPMYHCSDGSVWGGSHGFVRALVEVGSRWR